jgi:hypothetical protein
MLAASRYAEGHHGIVYDLNDLFNEVYLTKNYISVFALITLKIPTVQMLIANDNIRSAPKYTQAGRPLKRVKYRATRKRRFQSNGGHYSALPNQSINGNLEIQGVNSNIQRSPTNDEDATKAKVRQYFANKLTGLKIHKYKCSICGGTVHNCCTCNNLQEEFESPEHPVAPDIYVIGSDPFVSTEVDDGQPTLNAPSINRYAKSS